MDADTNRLHDDTERLFGDRKRLLQHALLCHRIIKQLSDMIEQLMEAAVLDNPEIEETPNHQRMVRLLEILRTVTEPEKWS